MFIEQGGEGDEKKRALRRKNLLRFGFEILLCGIPFKSESLQKVFLQSILDFKTDDIICINLIIVEMFSQYIYEPLFKKPSNSLQEVLEKETDATIKELFDIIEIDKWPDFQNSDYKKKFMEK